MNCRPNDIAVVVGEDAGCECNIGATLRVVSTEINPGDGRTEWVFAEASRPLWLLCGDWTTGNGQAIIADRYLVPIRDPGDPVARTERAPLEAAA